MNDSPTSVETPTVHPDLAAAYARSAARVLAEQLVRLGGTRGLGGGPIPLDVADVDGQRFTRNTPGVTVFAETYIADDGRLTLEQWQDGRWTAWDKVTRQRSQRETAEGDSPEAALAAVREANDRNDRAWAAQEARKTPEALGRARAADRELLVRSMSTERLQGIVDALPAARLTDRQRAITTASVQAQLDERAPAPAVQAGASAEERLRRFIAAQPTSTLIASARELDVQIDVLRAADPVNVSEVQAQILTRAWIIGALEERHPAAALVVEAAFEAADALDPDAQLDYVAVLAAAIEPAAPVVEMPSVG